MLGARSSWRRCTKRFSLSQRRPICKSSIGSGAGGDPQPSAGGGGGKKDAVAQLKGMEAYRDLDKLDFMKAARILFSDPPKKKRFGLDFHLVQLFFACLPSLAVYLVAQYARHDMKKMDAELEKNKKADEEKARETEANEAKQKIESNPELLKVKERLEALEEAVKEIIVETKKQGGDKMSKNPDANADSPQPQANKPELPKSSWTALQKNEPTSAGGDRTS